MLLFGFKNINNFDPPLKKIHSRTDTNIRTCVLYLVTRKKSKSERGQANKITCGVSALVMLFTFYPGILLPVILYKSCDELSKLVQCKKIGVIKKKSL